MYLYIYIYYFVSIISRIIIWPCASKVSFLTREVPPLPQLGQTGDAAGLLGLAVQPEVAWTNSCTAAT